MGIPTSKEAKLFFRVAEQRFADAEFLLGNDRTTAAVYFAGYGVECMLKASLLHTSPRGKRSETLGSFRGERGHNLDWLLAKCRNNGFSAPSRSSSSFFM